jgi:DNA-binding IclR family transcriptional regulator
MSNEAPSNVQSVDRALTILETLARSGEAGVTDLAVYGGTDHPTLDLYVDPVVSSA